MDWGEILLSLLLDLVITVLFYLFVPVIFCLRKKSLTKKQIKTIVIINGIVVWLIFQILTLELTGEASSGAAVLLWSFVAYKLLKRNCLEDDEQFEIPSRQAVRYCSRCGGEIDAYTKQCVQCGKRYARGIVKVGIVLLVILVLLIIIGVVGIVIDAINNDTTNTNNGGNISVSGNTSMSSYEYTIAMRIAEIVDGKDSEYFDYIQEAYKIARTGNASYGKGKGAVANYIDHLPIEYGEKIIMFRLIYQSDNAYCRDIVEYLNERDDISYDDTVYILTNLGFMVNSNGTVSWD